MTEVALLTTTSPDDPVEKVVGSDGKALPGTAVRVVDESGRTVPPGVEGNLFCRGCTAFAGYLQGRVFTEKFFDEDGWFETGDRAVMDADGFIRISGRSKDIIIRGGENIPVKEIEDVIISHPSVRNVALVALADERLSEIACACVIPEPGATMTMDDLRAHLAAKQVTRQFWPERLELMSEFPMTPSGKVQKFQLRDSLQATAAG
jgi:non-ribosomal peptide synthetase component E (peptide arylation enzyme)